jgi:hypothetical protein
MEDMKTTLAMMPGWRRLSGPHFEIIKLMVRVPIS